jgi:hypothetical protein
MIAAQAGGKFPLPKQEDFMPSRYRKHEQPKKTKKSKKNQQVVEFNAVAAKLGLGGVISGNNNQRG